MTTEKDPATLYVDAAVSSSDDRIVPRFRKQFRHRNKSGLTVAKLLEAKRILEGLE